MSSTTRCADAKQSPTHDLELSAAPDTFLVATLLSGTAERRRLLSERLLAELSSPWHLRLMGMADLREHGLRAREARRLACAIELGRRAVAPPWRAGVLRSPGDVHRFVARSLMGATHEQLLVVALDIRNRPRSLLCVGQGGVDTCPIDPREVFSGLLRQRASAFIVVHNHPSGDPEPSPEDVALTQRLSEAGKVLNLPLLDHVIVAGEHYVSLAERGVVRR